MPNDDYCEKFNKYIYQLGPTDIISCPFLFRCTTCSFYILHKGEVNR